MDAGADRLTLDPTVAAPDPRLLPGIGWTADEVVPSEVGEARRRAAAGKIRRRGDEETPCALEFSGDEARIRQFANPQRQVGAFGDQILVPVRHHEIDLEERMAGEERRQQRHDPPGAVARRQRHAQHAGETVGAARCVLRVVDRKQGVARTGQQRLAGLGGRDLPGGPDQKLDPEAPLERCDCARDGRLGQAELAGGPGEAAALHRPHE